jgi:hypothetical protein
MTKPPERLVAGGGNLRGTSHRIVGRAWDVAILGLSVCSEAYFENFLYLVDRSLPHLLQECRSAGH